MNYCCFLLAVVAIVVGLGSGDAIFSEFSPLVLYRAVHSLRIRNGLVGTVG